MDGNTTESSPKLGLRSEDHHWVEDLFPPHFIMQDLIESTGRRSEMTRVIPAVSEPTANLFSEIMSAQTSRRKQEIYVKTLQEVQRKEERERRKSLADRISRGVEAMGMPRPVDASNEKPAGGNQSPDRLQEAASEVTCVWNDQDISKLRRAIGDLERDRRWLRLQLQCAQEELGQGQERRRALQALVDDLEHQLTLSRQQTARQALLIQALRKEAQQRNTLLKMLTTQAKERAQEAAQGRSRLREAEKMTEEVRREHSNLAWELERLREEQRVMMERGCEAARVEHQVELQRLQRDLEQARVELGVERESHSRSRAALEVLRRHFSSQ